MMKATSEETALSLLASAVENLNTGCIAHLSENADGDSPHAQKGCTAQAWSDSELLRVWLKTSRAKAAGSIAAEAGTPMRPAPSVNIRVST